MGGVAPPRAYLHGHIRQIFLKRSPHKFRASGQGSTAEQHSHGIPTWSWWLTLHATIAARRRRSHTRVVQVAVLSSPSPRRGYPMSPAPCASSRVVAVCVCPHLRLRLRRPFAAKNNAFGLLMKERRTRIGVSVGHQPCVSLRVAKRPFLSSLWDIAISVTALRCSS
jgi:hypothetical protein